jgi:hypothetical protein
MVGLFTIDNLDAGIRQWREVTNFCKDFHNSFYAKLDSMSGIALTERWWEGILDDLAVARASRRHEGQDP